MMFLQFSYNFYFFRSPASSNTSRTFYFHITPNDDDFDYLFLFR